MRTKILFAMLSFALCGCIGHRSPFVSCPIAGSCWGGDSENDEGMVGHEFDIAPKGWQPDFVRGVYVQDPKLPINRLALTETVYAIEIREHDKLVVAVKIDGSVEYGEGFKADSAAKKFWEQLGKYYPFVCEAMNKKAGGSHD